MMYISFQNVDREDFTEKETFEKKGSRTRMSCVDMVGGQDINYSR